MEFDYRVVTEVPNEDIKALVEEVYNDPFLSIDEAVDAYRASLMNPQELDPIIDQLKRTVSVVLMFKGLNEIIKG